MVMSDYWSLKQGPGRAEPHFPYRLICEKWEVIMIPTVANCEKNGIHYKKIILNDICNPCDEGLVIDKLMRFLKQCKLHHDKLYDHQNKKTAGPRRARTHVWMSTTPSVLARTTRPRAMHWQIWTGVRCTGKMQATRSPLIPPFWMLTFFMAWVRWLIRQGWFHFSYVHIWRSLSLWNRTQLP